LGEDKLELEGAWTRLVTMMIIPESRASKVPTTNTNTKPLDIEDCLIVIPTVPDPVADCPVESQA
jgi:hypothetical protein